MNANWAALAGQLLVFAAAFAALRWERRRDKNKPAVDAATVQHTEVDATRLRQTIEDMSRRNNAWRDTRLAQLEGYLNLDAGWHFDVLSQQRILISQVKEMKSRLQGHGVDVSDISVPDNFPPPPPIPEPPLPGV